MCEPVLPRKAPNLVDWLSGLVDPTSVKVIPVLLFTVVKIWLLLLVRPLTLMICHSRERYPLDVNLRFGQVCALRGRVVDMVDNIEWVSLIFYNCLHNLVPPLVIDLLHTIKCHSFSCR